jgi:hypothetical protein
VLRAGGGDDGGGAQGSGVLPALRRRRGGHRRRQCAPGARMPAALHQEQAQVLMRALPPQPRRRLHPRRFLAACTNNDPSPARPGPFS